MSSLEELLRPARPEGDGYAAVAWESIKIFCVLTAFIIGVPLLPLLLITILY